MSTSASDGPLPIEVDESSDPTAWDAFVRQHPDGTYAHLFGWLKVARSYRRRILALEARRAGELVGVLPLVWMPGRLGGKRWVSMPYLDLGGPLATDDAVRAKLLESACDRSRASRARDVELRESGSNIEGGDRFRLLLDLPRDTESLWQQVSGKVRNQIRKAQKAELVTDQSESSEIGEFYRVFARNMRDLGSPVHSRRFFDAIFQELGEHTSLFLTRDRGGSVVAGAIAIDFETTRVVPWASALREARPSCPNHSLYWKILEDAVERGESSRFDFGRSTVDTGTYRFKKQWGAKPVPLAWSRLDAAGGVDRAQGGHSALDRSLVAVWKRLPLAVANIVGPAVRGRLPQ